MSINNSPMRGRPPKRAEEKRIQVNVRLLTADRERLQRLADESGKPLASEAEIIMAKHLSRRPETTALLDRIANEVSRLEAALGPKWDKEEKADVQVNWTKNLTAWAAVSEMLAHVAENDRPQRIHEDENVIEIRKRLETQERIRYVTIQLLAERGVSVKVDPRPAPLLGQSLRRGLFGSATAKRPSPREWEKAAIAAMPEGCEKEASTYLFDELLKLDDVIARIELEQAEAMRPYIEAEQAGRQMVTPLNALLAAALRPGIRVSSESIQPGTLGALLQKWAAPEPETDPQSGREQE